MSQGKRYLELAARAGGNSRELDASYRAAFYLLSYDPELKKEAERFVSYEGINFAAMKRATRGFDETSRQIIDIAHNLFSWTSNCKVTPFDISRLGYPHTQQVCDAFYIAFEQIKLVFEFDENNQIKMTLDASPYQRTQRIHRNLEQMQEEMLAGFEKLPSENDELER